MQEGNKQQTNNGDVMKIVKNMNTLKAMRKRGLISFCNDTGKKITGLYSNNKHTCYYVDDSASGFNQFEYNNKQYKLEYLSGCFYPYIIEREMTK